MAAGALHQQIEKRHGLDTMEVAGLVAKIIREEKPVKVNIDVAVLVLVLLIALKSRATATSSTA